MAQLQFHIIPSYLVDAEKWDRCIAGSSANRIYAKHIYLRHMADNWSGLIVNDYAAVMPIIWRKKWGIRYAYNAPFMQQSGLFGNYNAGELKIAVECVKKYISYGDLYFNHSNSASFFLPEVNTATNLIISLEKGYADVIKRYNNHLKSKLKKAAALSLQYVVSNDIVLAVQMYKQLYARRFPHVKGAHYYRLTGLAKQLEKHHQCIVRSVYDKEGNLLAIALFFKDENRIYNILPSTTAEGRKASAMHFLLDKVLKESAGQPLIFDFEGSDVPGIQQFYLSFGAEEEPYFHMHFNHLPIPIRWLKR